MTNPAPTPEAVEALHRAPMAFVPERFGRDPEPMVHLTPAERDAVLAYIAALTARAEAAEEALEAIQDVLPFAYPHGAIEMTLEAYRLARAAHQPQAPVTAGGG